LRRHAAINRHAVLHAIRHVFHLAFGLAAGRHARHVLHCRFFVFCLVRAGLTRQRDNPDDNGRRQE
jgi:hypothetical protein